MHHPEKQETNVQLIHGHYTSEAPPQTDKHMMRSA